MAGGLLQLVSAGIQDAPLTSNPEITFFKLMYKKYSNFAIQQTVKTLGTKKYGSYNSYKIDKTGDLLLNAHFIINIPKFDIIRTVNEVIDNSIYDVNMLEIIYNNQSTYIYNSNNNIYLIPSYMFKLFNCDRNNVLVDSNIIQEKLMLTLNNTNDYNIIDIKENTTNPIISLLRKYNNFFEDIWLNIILNGDYDYNNNLIIQSNYTNFIFNELKLCFNDNYNYYNNTRNNKKYYNLLEVDQYKQYQTIIDINFINKSNNYDVDIVYNYCIINNLDYKLYQTNAVLYNSLFLYNLLLQIYPKLFNTFTFWTKINLLENNVPNQNYINNTFNTFGEWETNFNNTFDSHLLNLKLQLSDIYKRNYSICQNNIIQLFSTLVISDPANLFIILSTFINNYDLTTTNINFDDYNSLMNTNLIAKKINEQLNNYSNLNIVNANIYKIPNISKYLTIYPVDLMVIYPYLAYKLVDKIISDLYFDDNIFLVYWRNKINNYYFLNYRQFDSKNIINNNLYDSLELNRKLTFYANFDLQKILFISNIKTYFLNLFYSSSFLGCVDFSDVEFINYKSTLNLIQLQALNINNVPISLSELKINTYSSLKLINNYNISIFSQNSYQIIISNWNNNIANTIFEIKFNNIIYNVLNFSLVSFELILNFDYITTLSNFILIETQNYTVPLISFYPSLKYPNNLFYKFNIFKIKTLDNIISSTVFKINNLIIELPKTIDDYFYYFKTIKITNSTETKRYIIDIINSNGNYQLVSTNNEEFNKDNIISIDIEFLQISYVDLGTIDSNSIIDNKFKVSNANNWTYDATKTYWLVNGKKYISLKYNNTYFNILNIREPVIYTIREINNNSFPSFYNFLNHYNNINSPSDLMDFFFQTPMIFLSKSSDFPVNLDVTYYTDYFSQPYLYFYNLPSNIDEKTKIYLNNKKVTIILPLNSNQYFGKKTSTVFDNENLTNNYTRINLLKKMNELFDLIFNDIKYINIINTLEAVNNELLNLNLNVLNDNLNYGQTTSTIIKNSTLINTYDLFAYNNNEFEKYNKLALDIYGNNPTLISNSIIQGLKYYIYNVPIVSFIGNRKISNDLIIYYTNIPVYFEEQNKYIDNNNDYLNISNKNQYLEEFCSLNQIKLNIEETGFDYDNYLTMTTLFPIDNINFSNIYFNNKLLTIDKYIDNYNLILITSSSNISTIINYDDMCKIEILDKYVEKFKYYGPIYLDNNSNINFNTHIDISGYNYIQLDNKKIYNFESDILNINIINHINYNGYLYNINNINKSVNYINVNQILYYYKIQLDISNNVTNFNTISGNYLYNNNKFYYYQMFNNNIIEVISNNKFDNYIKEYLVGFIDIITLNNMININSNGNTFNLISFTNLIILEYNVFNYYNQDLIIANSIIVDNEINPIIKKINNYNFIYINSNLPLINCNLITYTSIKLPPFKIDSNFEFILYGNDIDNIKIIKLDKYILKTDNLVNNILLPDNYELSYLKSEMLNLIDYNISGIIIITDKIEIIFSNLEYIPDNSYYFINNSFIYLSKIDNTIIINDLNLSYYKSGIFNKIQLLDNNYFRQLYPLVIDSKISFLYEDLLKKKIIGNIPIINNYDINSLLYNYNDIISYDISSISILGNDEMKIDIILNNNFIRPIIIKDSINLVPICNFVYFNNGNIFNNSLIILSSIPNITIAFATLEINFSSIIKIVALEPCFNIYSNPTLTSNTISFNDTTNILVNKIYLWKLLINDIFPVYFWTLITTNNLIYTSDQISEPVYINSNNLNLFGLKNYITFNGALPNILKLNNNILQINNDIFYCNQNRRLATRYYINNLFKYNGNQNVLSYNFHSSEKYEPEILLLNIESIKFNKNFIYLDLNSINILKKVNYIILVNGSNYYYCNIIKINNNGLIFEGGFLDNSLFLTIYYTFDNLIFTKNNILLIQNIDNNYEIINYDKNNINMNELIIINNNIFLVKGLNTWTKNYDLLLVKKDNSYCLGKNNGYISLGIMHKKKEIMMPKIEYCDDLIYNLDTANIKFGDYYLINNEFKIKTNINLESDIFAYYKTGINITITVINNLFFYFSDLDFINNNDILIYNNIIFKVKTCYNRQIFFYNNVNLIDNKYIFYYPYQPFNLFTFVINNNLIMKDTISNYGFIEINNIFYNVINNNIITNSTFSGTYLTRIVEFKNNYFFENELIIDNFVTSVINNEITIKIKGIYTSSTIIDLNSDKILNFHFYYLQSIKINSIINFVKGLQYRGTTTFIEVMNVININPNNILEITFTPNIININNYYSLFNIQNFKFENIQLNISDISNNIVGYKINNNKLESVYFGITNLNNLYFYNNYIPIDIINSTCITNQTNFEIGTFHLILEITKEKENIVHLIKIIYPMNLFFYSTIISIESTFYIDKIYEIVFNINTYEFNILQTIFYNKKRLLDTNNNLISIWYKYDIIIIGLPIYENNIFKLELLNGNLFINKDVYLYENSILSYKIQIINNKYYLISNTYLGNNISYIYLKYNNYIKNTTHIIKNWKNNYINHIDPLLNKYINGSEELWVEKIASTVIIVLDTIGDYYKYKIYTQDNKNLLLNINNTYTIGDVSLLIQQNFIYNNITYIFTKTTIIGSINNLTPLYTINRNKVDYFNKLNLSKTVPEIISKIKQNINIEQYIIFNIIKTWDIWSIISNFDSCAKLLNKGDILLQSNNIIQNDNNIYFTNNELLKLSNLLLFINNNPIELNKINQQQNILKLLLIQLDFWLSDSSFWLSVIDRINLFLLDNNFLNVIFNGECLIFDNEITNSNIYFDVPTGYIFNGNKNSKSTVNILKRKYILNNQYILLNGNQITRNTENILNELNLFITKNIGTEYGIEVNELLFTLTKYGNYYLKIINNIQNPIKVVNYFNSLKLIINTIWNNYSNELLLLNSNFNDNLKINYSSVEQNNQIYYIMTNNYELKQSNSYDINNLLNKDNELYIISSNLQYNLLSNPIYPYYIIFDKNIVIPEVVYEINFINRIFDSVLFDFLPYPNEMNFFLNNDINVNENYYIIGLNNYKIDSIFLGKIYQININNTNINFNIINNFNYKNNDINLYSYDNNILLISSLITLKINNFIELTNIVGILEQKNNYIKFYQNNFNYVLNETYIRTNELFIPLYFDISGNYYINENIILPNTVNIVLLFLIDNVIELNKYIYKLYLDKPFENYKEYIRNGLNIIATNFTLNNIYIPDDITLYTDMIFIVKLSYSLSIIKLTHSANLGETPPLQINSLIKSNIFLYNTNELYIQSTNNIIDNWSYKTIIYDISFNIFDLSNNNIDLSNIYIDICNLEYLNNTKIDFTLNNNYSINQLKNKRLLLINTWIINNYFFNPLNNYIQFDYPTNLKLNINDDYEYIINTMIINKKKIEIKNNKLIILLPDIIINISVVVIFNQIYKSKSIIYKPFNNQLAVVSLITDSDYSDEYNSYLIPYDGHGKEIGMYSYKITLLTPFIFNYDNINIELFNKNNNYNTILFYIIDELNLIITTNDTLLTNINYKILYNNKIFNVSNIIFYQNSYIPSSLYYQNNLLLINIFIPDNMNSFNFSNQPSNCRYYFVSKNIGINLENIFNKRDFESSTNMLIKKNIITNNYIKVEKPEFVSPIKWLEYVSLYLGEQLIETLNEDTINIVLNYYSTDEQKKQLLKLFKIIENKDGWQIFIPLLFWFCNNSGLALPLVALPHSDFYLKYKVQNLGAILLNDITNVNFSKEPLIKIELCLDTIILDIPERKLFGSYQHEYIIERFNIYTSNLIYLTEQIIPINFKNLVKDIFWISQPIYNLNDTAYKNIIYERDSFYNSYCILQDKYLAYQINPVEYLSDFLILENIKAEILINKSTRIIAILNNQILNKYELKYILYLSDKYFSIVSSQVMITNLILYFTHLFKNNIQKYDISPISSFNLQSNGTNLFYNYDYSYYSYVVPYQKFNNSVPLGYYSYSFSLNPLDKQPSGHLNFNHLDNMVINLTNNKNVINEPFNLKTIVKEYQILRFMSGLGSLA